MKKSLKFKEVNSISFIMPFFNEEKNLRKAYSEVFQLILNKKIKNYEIIFINDGSTDNSHKIIKKIKNLKIKYIKNNVNRGLGYSLLKGVKISKKKYVLLVPTDNEVTTQTLTPIFSNFGLYDLTIPYVINKEIRTWWRRFLSSSYTLVLQILFLKKLPYFNGLVLYKKKIVIKVIKKINNTSFSCLPEMLLKTLKISNNYQIVGYRLKKSGNIKSKAFTFKNIILTIFSIIKLRFTMW
jgi:cellulose synthase/poly-beta-1,6-N-acetylglucosamine synthase-like glycosyltransferase